MEGHLQLPSRLNSVMVRTSTNMSAARPQLNKAIITAISLSLFPSVSRSCSCDNSLSLTISENLECEKSLMTRIFRNYQ